ncbi:MAG: Crp/Fnr family transcriptional regulator [Gammaproteobacteria bacterium]|nr:Crp/Fnr family transcriptional regulator [Gammaproteobacteria bacterium]MDH5729330.1 Crp/Fnr family transcriptional regulator [Gammaproteobacteria bacterium]
MDHTRVSTTGFLPNIHTHARKQLIQLGKQQSWGKNEMIFHTNAPARNVYILLSGRVKISQLSSAGKEACLWFCFPGELFGLAEVLHSNRRKVHAQACCTTTAIVISEYDFKQHLIENPDIAMSVIDLLADRLRLLSDSFTNLATEDVTGRLVNLLNRLGKIYGRKQPGYYFLDMPLTHQEIAEMIGTSRQTVTTILNRLKRSKLITSEKHGLLIPETMSSDFENSNEQALRQINRVAV